MYNASEELLTLSDCRSTGKVSYRGVPIADLTFTVVDIETTGLKPQGNGITEISCVRVVAGQMVGHFTTLINPGRPIPRFIQAMTGISDAMVRGAPTFAAIAPKLLEYLGDTVLVAHNAPFDLSFLNYGLYCCGRGNLSNPVVDTRRLARRLLPGLPRAGLDAVTQHLGIAIESRHRARGDAEATAAVLLRLLSVGREQGIETDAQLLALLSPAAPVRQSRRPSRKDVYAARLATLAERCRAFPDAPGVYLMRSATNRVLYVGKAISLRKRVASYFASRVAPKIRRLMQEVETIEHLQVGSELEALLEESRLIKQHQPPFNTLLRSYRDCPFIKLDESGPYPRLAIKRQVDDDGARYFGPFRSVRGTELALEILSRCFRLFDARCPDPANARACLYLQMNRCLGPCFGPEFEARHRQAVDEVCRLLEAEPDQLLADMIRRREEASERLDFETAALYRDGIDALARAFVRRKLLAPAIEDLNLLAVCPSLRPGWAELFVFGDGRLLARARLAAEGDGLGRSAAESFLRTLADRWIEGRRQAPIRIDAASLDQVNIISNWLEEQGGGGNTIALEPGWAPARFSEVLEQVLMAVGAVARQEEP